MDVLEYPEPLGAPLGAKGLAEAPIIPTAPAIRNAIYDAIGKPLYELPMTAERVLPVPDAGCVRRKQAVCALTTGELPRVEPLFV